MVSESALNWSKKLLVIQDWFNVFLISGWQWKGIVLIFIAYCRNYYFSTHVYLKSINRRVHYNLIEALQYLCTLPAPFIPQSIDHPLEWNATRLLLFLRSRSSARRTSHRSLFFYYCGVLHLFVGVSLTASNWEQWLLVSELLFVTSQFAVHFYNGREAVEEEEEAVELEQQQ